ncbi:MAG TPA: sulfite exporter TauE/SafE family protein [Aliidongia sp.]|uniref:sulfite exporter TauE/SafE family protein n=1 Tax=Aliidongia sp. TaxID=1914230 RepID=UPI002DDD20E5|nr:sulfite exporter TauE/SafE family protein [Aliidongia sp.]HEV2675291.1 sulfite exporter TauE/SafE family protein [Aliidongia sp.]
MASYIFVLLVGLVAGCVSGIIGTGSSIMLLPVLVFTFGPKQAVPIMAIAAVMANVARVMAWWREVDWRACAAYSVTGVPAAALGARTLLVLPPRVIDVALGIFFLAMIPGRRWLARRNFRIRLWQLAIAGAVIGYLTGIVLSTGPLSVPAFTAYGLSQGAFLSTEAASSLALYVSKVVTFRELGALPLPTILQGAIVGSSLMVGAFVAKRAVLRMGPETFRHLLDALMLVSGLSLLWAALD